jgi:hypothetical protein
MTGDCDDGTCSAQPDTYPGFRKYLDRDDCVSLDGGCTRGPRCGGGTCNRSMCGDTGEACTKNVQCLDGCYDRLCLPSTRRSTYRSRL